MARVTFDKPSSHVLWAIKISFGLESAPNGVCGSVRVVGTLSHRSRQARYSLHCALVARYLVERLRINDIPVYFCFSHFHAASIARNCVNDRSDNKHIVADRFCMLNLHAVHVSGGGGNECIKNYRTLAILPFPLWEGSDYYYYRTVAMLINFYRPWWGAHLIRFSCLEHFVLFWCFDKRCRRHHHRRGEKHKNTLLLCIDRTERIIFQCSFQIGFTCVENARSMITTPTKLHENPRDIFVCFKHISCVRNACVRGVNGKPMQFVQPDGLHGFNERARFCV